MTLLTNPLLAGTYLENYYKLRVGMCCMGGGSKGEGGGHEAALPVHFLEPGLFSRTLPPMMHSIFKKMKIFN